MQPPYQTAEHPHAVVRLGCNPKTLIELCHDHRLLKILCRRPYFRRIFSPFLPEALYKAPCFVSSLFLERGVHFGAYEASENAFVASLTLFRQINRRVVSFRPQATTLTTIRSAIGRAGFPPTMRRCVRMAPIIIGTRRRAQIPERAGIKSRIADANSMSPIT